jgi:hypothetical protein
LHAIGELEKWYQDRYPDYYASNRPAIRNALDVLKDLYQKSVFPDMDVSWQTHPDNIGHAEFPGCFRCHDGKHLSQNKEAIRLECNLCHSVPQETVSGRGLPVVQLVSGPEPASHLSSKWIARHRFSFDETAPRATTRATQAARAIRAFAATLPVTARPGSMPG